MSGGPPRAVWFARISRDLLQDGDLPVTLERVVARGVLTVPGAEACSLTLRGSSRRPVTAAATRADVVDVDDLQYAWNEGPCLEAVKDDAGTLVASDLRIDPRWPRWGPAAAEAGYRSVLAVRLQDVSHATGALNLYASGPDAFGPESIDVAEIYAEHAAAALDHAREIDGLRTAMESRHRIGMAQGVLAIRYGIGFEEAFEVLRRLASDTNTKLRDLAAEVLERRELPPRLVSGVADGSTDEAGPDETGPDTDQEEPA